MPGEPTRDDVSRFVDLFMRDWIDRAWSAVYRRMSQRYRATHSLSDLESIVGDSERVFGTLQAAHAKWSSVRIVTTRTEVRKSWGFWYAIRTAKYGDESHFAAVDLVAEPDLAVTAFQIVTRDDVPPDLRR